MFLAREEFVDEHVLWEHKMADDCNSNSWCVSTGKEKTSLIGGGGSETD
jgi:hypothetical protein